MKIMLVLVFSYLIGSIPFGYIVGRFKGIDIRQHGSGNIGTTNVWRTLGPLFGVLVFICDAAKGIIGVMLGRYTGIEGIELLTGLAALAGHSWPIFLGFHGGKIVATGAGVLMALSPLTLVIVLGVWGLVLAIFRYVSVSSICAALVLPISLYVFNPNLHYLLFGLLVALLAIYKHIPNLKRLLAGNEFKVGTKK